MKQYEKYKSSGIDWIGEIPSHWQLKKLKYLGQSIIGITYSPDDVAADESGILVLRSSNIQNGILDFKDSVFVKKDVQQKHLTYPGDILLCARNGSAHLVGKSALIDEKSAGVTFGAFMTVYRSEAGRFFYYFFNSQVFKAQTGLFTTSTINQLTSDTLSNMFAAVPPNKEEQTAIANFLDEKTKQIDKLIADKQSLIELLKEERIATINDAVSSRGKKWERKKLRYLCKITTGAKNTEDRVEDGEYPFFVRSQTVEKINSYSFDGEGILTAGDGVGVAKVFHYINGKFDFHQRVYLFYDFSCEIFPKYLFHFIEMNLIYEVLKYNAKSTVDSLRLPMLKDFVISFPSSKEEQVTIVNYIQTEAQRINNTVSKIEKEIESMNEYRTALISEVVTGKIKVIP